MGASFEPITARYFTMEIDGVAHRIFVEEAGQGIPLLCLHTAGADSRQYRHLLNDPAITSKYRKMEAVIAWNQPMLRRGKSYVFGVMAASNHLLIAPWGGLSDNVLGRLKGLEVNKKTVRVPADWKVDAALLRLMVKERLAELDD
mgnify:CR=1 FL=1